MAGRKRRHFLINNGKLQYSDIILLLILVSLVSVQLTKWVLTAGANQSTNPQTSQVEKINTKTRAGFIQKLVPIAQNEQREHKILPSITLAQAALESNWGQSTLASKYHNLFGVKSYGKNSVLLETKEYVNGQWITVKANFATYSSWESSVKAHTNLFVYGTSWNKDKYRAVLNAGNYKEAAKALQEAGYATDPTYAQKLISLIEQYHLDQYDLA